MLRIYPDVGPLRRAEYMKEDDESDMQFYDPWCTKLVNVAYIYCFSTLIVGWLCTMQTAL